MDPIKSLCLSVAFGIAIGLLQLSLKTLCDASFVLRRIPAEIIKNYRNMRRIFRRRKAWRLGNDGGKGYSALTDFVYVVLCGISLSILLYVTVDGAFRLHIVAIALASAYVLRRFAEKPVSFAVQLVFSVVSGFAIRVISLIGYPIYKIGVYFTRRVILPIKERIHSLERKLSGKRHPKAEGAMNKNVQYKQKTHRARRKKTGVNSS